MMRLIDADALVNALSAAKDTAPELLGRPIIDVSDMVRMIEDLPTVDAVPVVRCKDCVSYNNHFSQKGFGWCEEEALRIVNDNFYCGYAVKKGEEVNDRDAD